MSLMSETHPVVVVRGGGDLATGTIYMLHRAGFYVLVLESARPSAIRRTVAFCEAVYEGAVTVEGVTARLVTDMDGVHAAWERGEVAVIVDPDGDVIWNYTEDGSLCPKDGHSRTVPCVIPVALVDAIMAKRNLGTRIDMAPFVIALGPGFTAGVDCHAVVETMRGHNLGRVYYEGSAEPDTGVPGLIAGHDKDRVIHAEAAGVVYARAKIGDVVKKGDVIGVIEAARGTFPSVATIDGVLRGVLRDKYPVTKGFKIADIDPRIEERDNCYTISDKARCIGGGVLAAIMASDL